MTIKISHQFCGPPNSGNGGYVCGLLDRQTGFLSEVTLRKPIPLEKDLSLIQEGEVFQLRDGETLIAEACPGQLVLIVPEPPTFEEAVEAAKNYAGLQGRHAFPGCFVCGPDHTNGMYIFAGRHGDSDIFASPWIPDAALADAEGHIKSEFIWAALDCPGSFAIVNEDPQPIVLGRMTTEIMKPVKSKEKCVVIGWALENEGRKHYCGTAVFNEKKELCAAAKAIWFKI